MEYLLHLLVFVFIYGMVGLSLNVASGFTKLMSLAHAGFFGVGAYSTAILATKMGWPALVNLPIAMTITAALAFPLGIIALRTIDDYFIICTMGMGIILSAVMNNWFEMTRGPLGVFGIPAMAIVGYPVTEKWEWVCLVVAFYVVLLTLAQGLKRSAFGRILVAISEDEILCQSQGKNVGRAKIQSFVLGAALAAVPGVLYAHYVSFIDPSTFSVRESIFILSIIIIGRLGNLVGSLWAAAFLVLLPEALRFVGLPTDVAGHVRQILYGATLITVMWIQYRRSGRNAGALNSIGARLLEQRHLS